MLLCVCTITNAQIAVFISNPQDSLFETKKMTIVSKLNCMFETNNKLLGVDSIKQILKHTYYYTIPLLSIVNSNHNNVIKHKYIQGNKRNRSKLFIDYYSDTLELLPYPDRIAWVFMIYDNYLLGYYHFSSQNKEKKGDFYTVQTLVNTNLKLNIFEFPIKDKDYFAMSNNLFAIYGYLCSKFYYQDSVLFLHSNCHILKQINAFDLL